MADVRGLLILVGRFIAAESTACGAGKRRQRRRPLTGIDLFAGCGGLTEGLKLAGIDVRWACEHDHNAAAAWQLNNPGATMYCMDVGRLAQRLQSSAPGFRGNTPKVLGCVSRTPRDRVP